MLQVWDIREGHDLPNEQQQKSLIIRGMQTETSVRITLHWSGWPSSNHSDSTDSSNPRTQYAFPFLPMSSSISFIKGCIVFGIQVFLCPHVGLLFLM